MTVSIAQTTSFKFRDFALDTAKRQLFGNGKTINLKPRAFDLLEALVRRSDRLVSKGELLDIVWPSVTVEENNVEVHVSALRKVLGPGAIGTVPGRGYRFTLLDNAGSQTTEYPWASLAPDAGMIAGNLPAQHIHLYGREADVAAIIESLDRSRLVSVIGPAGIGKTCTALAVAHRLLADFRDGVWRIELAPISDPDVVAQTIGRALGEQITPGPYSSPSLLDALRGKQALLLVDNCEHLAERVAELTEQILSVGPGIRILTTSQEALHVAQEQVIRLESLSVPDPSNAASALEYGAVALFVARARSVDPRFALGDQNVEDVIEICARLDGIPLALELAAARILLLGTRALRQRLDDRLNILAGGLRRSLPRHQTLRSALEWSYSLLSTEEQSVFDRLSVFAGSFSLEAAQLLAVPDTSDQWAVLDHLASLVDKSLVLVEPTAEPRYRMLESSRALGLDHLARSGELAVTRRRHAQAMATILESRGLRDPHTFERFCARWTRIAPDFDNARGALAWACGPEGDRAVAIDLLGATHFMWSGAGYTAEVNAWFQIIEPVVDDTIQPERAAQFWLSLADLRMYTQLPKQARAGLRAADIFRTIGEPFGECLALLAAAWNLAYSGESQTARQTLIELEGLIQPDWPPYVGGLVDLGYGIWMYLCRVGAFVDARDRLQLAVEKFRAGASDEAFEYAFASMMIVHCYYASRDFESALQLGNETLENPFVRNSPWIHSLLRPAVATALTGVGRLEEAALMLRDAVLRLKRSTGTGSWVFSHVAYLVARQGRLRDAARLIGFVDRTRSVAGSVWAPHLELSYEMAMDLVQRGLSDEEIGAHRSLGRQLTEDSATKAAF
jgi:predicted ATPase